MTSREKLMQAEQILQGYVRPNGNRKNIDISQLERVIRSLPQVQLVEILKEIQAQDPYGGVLHHAAVRGHIALFKCIFDVVRLQNLRRQLLYSHNAYNKCVIHSAVDRDQVETIEYILDELCSKNQRTHLLRHQSTYTSTPLHHSVLHSQIGTTKFLIDCISQRELQNIMKFKGAEEQTILHFAAWSNTPEVLELLLCQIQDESVEKALMQKDSHGYTPLMRAARAGKMPHVRCLLEHLRTNDQRLRLLWVKNSNGETAEHMATQGGHEDIVKYLQQYAPKMTKAEKTEVYRSSFIKKIDGLKSFQKDLSSKKDKYAEEETNTKMEIDELTKKLALQKRKQEETADERDNAKLKCNKLDTELIEARRELKKKESQIEKLLESHADLTAAHRKLVENQTGSFSSGVNPELKELLDQKEQAKKDYETKSIQLEEAKKDLAKCEEQLNLLKGDAEDTRKQREKLEHKQDDCKNRIEVLEKQTEVAKEKLEKYTTRVKQLEHSAGSRSLEHSSVRKSEPARLTIEAVQPDYEINAIPLETDASDVEISCPEEDFNLLEEELLEDIIEEPPEAAASSEDDDEDKKKEQNLDKDLGITSNVYEEMANKGNLLDNEPAIALPSVWKCKDCGSSNLEKVIARKEEELTKQEKHVDMNFVMYTDPD